MQPFREHTPGSTSIKPAWSTVQVDANGTPVRMRRWVVESFMEKFIMLTWALTFLVIAIIAAIFGFGGIAGTASGIAQILFFIFVVLFVISLIVRATQGRSPRP